MKETLAAQLNVKFCQNNEIKQIFPAEAYFTQMWIFFSCKAYNSIHMRQIGEIWLGSWGVLCILFFFYLFTYETQRMFIQGTVLYFEVSSMKHFDGRTLLKMDWIGWKFMIFCTATGELINWRKDGRK